LSLLLPGSRLRLRRRNSLTQRLQLRLQLRKLLLSLLKPALSRLNWGSISGARASTQPDAGLFWCSNQVGRRRGDVLSEASPDAGAESGAEPRFKRSTERFRPTALCAAQLSHLGSLRSCRRRRLIAQVLDDGGAQPCGRPGLRSEE